MVKFPREESDANRGTKNNKLARLQQEDWEMPQSQGGLPITGKNMYKERSGDQNKSKVWKNDKRMWLQ